MLRHFGSCAGSSTFSLKCSALSCTALGYRRSGHCREPWLGTLSEYGVAIVASGKDNDIVFCSRLLPSLHVSCMSLAVFTIALMRWPAGNESCSTVSADGAQPLRVCGHSGIVRQPRCPGSLARVRLHSIRHERVTILIIRCACYPRCGARLVAEDIQIIWLICCDGRHISPDDSSQRIQVSAWAPFFLCHFWAE